MIDFSWRGIDENGVVRKGVFAAHSQEEVRTELLKQRVALLMCKQRPSSFFVRMVSSIRSVLGSNYHIAPSERIYLFRSLSLLFSSGVSVIEGLNVLSTRMHLSGKVRTIIGDLSRDVKRGMPFSVAMENIPEAFSTLMIHLVRAGEEAGDLAGALSHLATYLQEGESLKKQLRGAALLPVMTLAFAIVMLVGIGIFIIPRFEELFSSTQVELPPLSQLVFSASAYMRSWYFPAFITVFVGLVSCARYVLSKKKIRGYIDNVSTRLPLVGKIYQLVDLVHFTESLAMLLSSGMPMPVSLRYASGTTQGRLFQTSTLRLYDEILKGVSLEEALKSETVFPVELASMVAIGERSGNLSLMLGKASDLFKDELQHRLTLFTTVLQPVLMVVVGGIIALVLVAVYMPIMSLAGAMPMS